MTRRQLFSLVLVAPFLKRVKRDTVPVMLTPGEAVIPLRTLREWEEYKKIGSVITIPITLKLDSEIRYGRRQR